ncbi:MAG TPA: carotenoid oxygenase family protein [Steroidobacteraceae bacterium]|nr:carotenoid oxygenase family protein [Steroidobacteraceae bacterium]
MQRRPPIRFSMQMSRGPSPPIRAQIDLVDCEVEGELPVDLEGAFYRVGPDFQYPPRLPNIPFDGEGHIGMFRFSNGHVDYKSRYIRTQRYKAQAAAREALFGTYRNPHTDDERVRGLSRGTANTAAMFHHGKLMAFKEDSPPVVMDPDTLETLDDYYTFGGKLTSLTFTAHPKIDSETGDLFAFGYEARGEATDDVAIIQVDRHGTLRRETWIKVPYVGMIHDFAVTQRHIALLVIPMITDVEGMKQGRVHFAWDSSLPSWLGVMRRDGDGGDLRWFKGPERCATHTMGCFSDGERVYLDVDMALKNQFPFFPNKDGSPFDAVAAEGRVTRLSVDLAQASRPGYELEVLYPHTGVLSRQDDRYHTVPYSVGFLRCLDAAQPVDPRLTAGAMRPLNTWTRFDHPTRRAQSYFGGAEVSLEECCFVPRSPRAPEGDGYLLGVAQRPLENRSELLVLDARRLAEGPLARVLLPIRIFGQIHGWWVPDWHRQPHST